MGFAPVKLLMSTSVYSLGAIGGLKSMFKGFVKGEISDLTTLVYDAREHVFDRIEQRGRRSSAPTSVVGIKTYIVELGSGLIEFVAVGTAVRRMAGARAWPRRSCRRRRSCATRTPGSAARAGSTCRRRGRVAEACSLQE